MFFIKDYVPASSIWPNAEDENDLGYIAGLVRGYNIEVEKSSGATMWLSCEYIHESVETEFDDEFHRFYFKEHGWTPTGRVCFRGYGYEKFDHYNKEAYIEKIDMTGERIYHAQD